MTNNRKITTLSTSLHCTEEELYDAMSASPKRCNSALLSFIKAISSKLEEFKIKILTEGRRYDSIGELSDDVRALIFGAEKKNKGQFLRFYQEYIKRYDKRSTKESFEYTLSMLKKYCTEDALARLKFADIKYAWLSDLELWLTRRDLSQNTRKIHLGNIRTIMRAAYRRELTDVDPFRRFSVKPGKTRKRSLSVDELRNLFTSPVISQTEFYRDMMKLSFMLLGINTIDLYELKELRKDRVEYDRSKTGGIFSVKVEPEAMEIIQKYKGVKGLLCIADRWSDYRNFRRQMNAAIKRIGKACGKGVKDNDCDGPFAEVTSYWMRHAWASIAYELGVSDDTISQALGHQGSGARVTEVYIRRNMDRVDAANRRVLDWVLYGKKAGTEEVPANP